MGPNEILNKYVPKHERQSVVEEAHGGVGGRHYGRKGTTQKILRDGLWWCTIHKDENNFVECVIYVKEQEGHL